jgi:nitrile hydratase beta subunit
MSYRSHADLGGRDESRAVIPETEGELFHAAWEPRVLALSLAMGATGLWNIDMARAARETLDDYAARSYYEIWLGGLETLLRQSGAMADPPTAQPRPLAAASVAAVLARGTPYSRPATAPARFAVGDWVRTTAAPADHHTRLPGYARDRRGRIERIAGVHVFADSNAHGLGERPQWLYTVAFEAAELWGAAAAPGAPVTVSVDAWESYLEAT